MNRRSWLLRMIAGLGLAPLLPKEAEKLQSLWYPWNREINPGYYYYRLTFITRHGETVKPVGGDAISNKRVYDVGLPKRNTYFQV